MERGLHALLDRVDAPSCSATASASLLPQTTTGRSPARSACAKQVRRATVRALADAIGVDFARRYITQFGFKLESLPPNLSMSLGTASLTPMSVARGYTVFANGGFLVEPYFIERIIDRNGVVVAQTHPPRACRACPQRLTTEARTAVVVDISTSCRRP